MDVNYPCEKFLIYRRPAFAGDMCPRACTDAGDQNHFAVRISRAGRSHLANSLALSILALLGICKAARRPRCSSWSMNELFASGFDFQTRVPCFEREVGVGTVEAEIEDRRNPAADRHLDVPKREVGIKSAAHVAKTVDLLPLAVISHMRCFSVNSNGDRLRDQAGLHRALRFQLVRSHCRSNRASGRASSFNQVRYCPVAARKPRLAAL